MVSRDYTMTIDSPLVNEAAINYRLPCWPPPCDFPIVVTQDGTVVSRYSDSVWDLSAWDHLPKIINFGDGPQRNILGNVSKQNADVFRMVVASWLWGPRSVFAAGTLVSQHRAIKSIFVRCSANNVDARHLSRYHGLVKEIAVAIPPSARSTALSLLHALYEQRIQLGFTILDRDALKQLSAAFPPSKDVEQTAYIPPRIWLYQVSQLRSVISDFQIHKTKVEACYKAVLEIYEINYGSLAASRGNPNRHALGGRGTFERLAREFGIYELLCRWYQHPKGRKSLPVSALTNYLALVIRAGLAYILNFSLMRIQEVWKLRVDCFHIEVDDRIGDVAILTGPTTKTMSDDYARWITCPTVADAVEVMATISSWRTRVLEAYGESSSESPFLYLPTCEPWKIMRRVKFNRGMYPSYATVMKDYPKLFDREELRVTKDDWLLAKSITPTLDESTFGVGKVWRFAWHQLRRTGTVNMQASGLVSNFSIQYQLKHATVAMSLYYGKGYSQLRFNSAAKAEYIREMYEVMGKELNMLLSDRFVSPYGDERKHTILKIVSESDNNKLLNAAKAGRVAWRRTLLGGCTKSGPCEYGGIDNIVRCGGGDGKAPCADALFDRKRMPDIQKLHQVLSNQLELAESGSPQQSSIQAQIIAAENALNVIANHK